MLITDKDEILVEDQLCGLLAYMSVVSQGFYKGGKFVFGFKVRMSLSAFSYTSWHSSFHLFVFQKRLMWFYTWHVDEQKLFVSSCRCKQIVVTFGISIFFFTCVFQVGQGYPHDPPKVKCDTMVYHPNIDLEGNVCLNILRWVTNYISSIKIGKFVLWPQCQSF